MDIKLVVTHGLGDQPDVFPAECAVDFQDGALLVLQDPQRRVVVKAYNRDVWAAVAYQEWP